MEELNAIDQMFADFGKKVYRRLCLGDTSELPEAAKELEKQVVEMGAKFKRGDKVYILNSYWSVTPIVECEVADIEMATDGENRWYALYDTVGNAMRRVYEGFIFKTDIECAEFFRDFCDDYINKRNDSLIQIQGGGGCKS